MVPISIGVVQGHATKRITRSVVSPARSVKRDRVLGAKRLSALTEVHPATRRMLANWGYRYNVWKLRRFASAKRIAIALCFLHAARAETTDAIVEMQDKLITAVHSKARQRYEDLLRATEEARSRAVEILEELGTVVLGSRQHPCRNLL